MERWNLENGGREPIFPCHDEDGFTCFTWHFPAVGSLMAHLTPRGDCWIADANVTIDAFDGKTIAAHGCPEGEARVTLRTAEGERTLRQPAAASRAFVPADSWRVVFSTPNALILNSWKVAFDKPEYDPAALSRPDFDFSDFMNFRMGTWALQLPYERAEDTYPVDLVYVTRFNCRYCPDDLQMMIDGFRCEHYEVYLNGERVEDKPVRSYLDAEIGVIPLRNIHAGENTITVRMTVGGKNAGILDLLKLIGTFSVGKDEQGEYIDAPVSTLRYGDWCEQGYPYLAATVDYTQEITLPEEMLGHELVFTADVGDDLYEVLVNGQKVDTRLWQPYESRLTDAITGQTFTLTVRVVNTVANILEAQRKPSGLNGCAITAYPKYHFDV